MSLRFSEHGESLLVLSEVLSESFLISGESLLISHLRINDNIYLLILVSRLNASTQAGLDHQLHNSFETVKSLFWCHRFFLQVRWNTRACSLKPLTLVKNELRQLLVLL